MAVDVPDSARCLGCGYLLRGLPNPVCPECGHRFDPADRNTYHDPIRFGAELRPLRPPDVASTLFLLALVLCAIWARSAPKPLSAVNVLFVRLAEAPEGLLVLPVLIIVAWPFMHTLRQRRRIQRAGRDDLLEDFDRHKRRWHLQVACMLLLLLLLFLPVPAMLRFYVTLPWLEARADAYLTDSSGHGGPQHVALWNVEQVWGRGQNFVWFQVGHDGQDRFGIVRHEGKPAYSKPRIWLTWHWCFERW